MPTPSERRALLFVAAVAALGLGVRGCRALSPAAVDAAPRAALAAQIAAVDSAVSTGGRPRARRPSRDAAAQATGSSPGATPASPAAPVDLDRAGVAELDALPGIGPALAQRIVDDRAAHGAFGSLEALQDVRGIGPALAAKLAPLVTFSGPPRQPLSPVEKRRSLHP